MPAFAAPNPSIGNPTKNVPIKNIKTAIFFFISHQASSCNSLAKKSDLLSRCFYKRRRCRKKGWKFAAVNEKVRCVRQRTHSFSYYYPLLRQEHRADKTIHECSLLPKFPTLLSEPDFGFGRQMSRMPFFKNIQFSKRVKCDYHILIWRKNQDNFLNCFEQFLRQRKAVISV